MNGNTEYAGGSGGSGIVIVRYRAATNRYPEATGGYVQEARGFRTHTFTNGGEFVVTKRGAMDVLVVAGGGGGGVSAGGGGGAGGVICYTNYIVALGTNVVTVGAGGTGGPVATWTASNGFNSALGILTAIGGGAGSGVNSLGGSGGSGGGASRWSNGNGQPGAGTAGQGYGGGSSPYVWGGGCRRQYRHGLQHRRRGR
jgi:hypothetical protein